MLLDPFFQPKGIAIIGASRDKHKLGYGVVANLVEHGYRGGIYPVNPMAKSILQQPVFPTIDEVPDPVDLAIIVVPAAAVLAAVEAAALRGIRHMIIVSGGFGESGEAGKALEQQLSQLTEKYKLRLIGPNCVGTIDTHTPLNSTFVTGMPQPGDIGFISHSGAMCAVVIDWARGAGVGFSRIVSLGNQIDVNETDLIELLANDKETRVITGYLESVSDGKRFLQVAAEAAKEKPLVMIKAGVSEAGGEAVASHTGALAGAAVAYEAAFAGCGILHARTMNELFDWGRALAWQPLPAGKRIAVLTNAGGPGILAVDALEAEGLSLAPLTAETKAFLKQRLPAAGNVNNPVDILAGSGAGLYAVALDALLSDATVDAAVVIQAPQDWFLPASLAEVIGEVSAVHHKPVLASIMGLASVDQAAKILHRRRIPNFPFPEQATSALGAMWARKQWLEQLPTEPVHIFNDIDHSSASKAMESEDWPALLTAYGCQLPTAIVVENENDALEAAERLGYPVVMKLQAEGLSHKSDIGGVRLDIDHETTVRRTFRELRAIAVNHDVHCNGVLMQKMMKDGHELIMGMKRDPQFGPLFVIGTGGVEVELRQDVRWSIGPLTPAQVQEMLDQTQAGKRLQGWRNIPPGDVEAVIEAFLRLAQLSVDFPQIVEIEANPLYVLGSGEGAFALDVRGSSHPSPAQRVPQNLTTVH